MGFNNNGGGGGALSGLNDIALDNPSSNNVLSYDGSTNKWKNTVAPTGATAISDVTGLQSALDKKIVGYNGAAGLWIGTQAQYDAITTKSPTTLYAITEE